MRNGIACGTVEQIVRKAYVDEAFAGAEDGQTKVTVSSVAAQTGLSRKEVKRLRELGDEAASEGRSPRYNRAIRVITGWLNDRRYSSAEGVALALPLQGDLDGQSFPALVKDYSGDVTTKAMLDLLQSSGSVRVSGDQVQLVRHAYVPANDPSEVLRILGNDVEELVRTIDHNLTCEPDEVRFQRKVSTWLLPSRLAEEFKELSRRRSQALLEELVIWLNAHEAAEDEESQYVSVGVYLYEPRSAAGGAA
tara:strand:+ start:488 stop:1237 length:750 start_codon:yes stop_codon:yes gene_type:complete